MNYIENFEMATLCLTSIKREIGAMSNDTTESQKEKKTCFNARVGGI